MSMPNSEPMGGVLNQPEAYQNRNAAMNDGINGGPTASPGLQQQAQQDNQGGPARVRMSGSVNGISQAQATDTFSGTLPTSNGQSQSSFEAKKWLEPRQQ